MSSTDPTREQSGAFDRLREADPAADAAPDLAAVRARVDKETGVGPAGTQGPPVPVEHDASSTVVPLVRTRRPARWLQVAAASAGVLAIGLGGYAVGHRSGDVVAVADAPAPEGPAARSHQSGEPAPEPAAAGGLATAETAADLSVPWYSDRTVFDQVGLSDAPGRASAWAFDGSAVYSEETAARVAAAFGITDAPSLSGGYWHVGPSDWTGRFVDLTPDSQVSFSFTDTTLDPWAEGGTPPAGDVATTALTDLMTTLGVDVAAYELTVEEGYGASATIVRATRLVDGAPTALIWEAMVAEDGLASVYGHLASPVDLGEYDVVSPQEAVARLTDPRFGQSGAMIAYQRDAAVPTDPADALVGPTAEQAYPAENGGSDAEPAPELVEPAPAQPGVGTLSPAPTVPPAPAPGESFAWPVEQVTITGATLTLAVHTQPDGSTVLLPTYELTSDDGGTWSVVAVADAQLDLTPRG